jgi:hypothetical protein
MLAFTEQLVLVFVVVPRRWQSNYNLQLVITLLLALSSLFGGEDGLECGWREGQSNLAVSLGLARARIDYYQDGATFYYSKKVSTFGLAYDGFLLAAMFCALIPILTGVVLFLGFVSFYESEGDKHRREGIAICFCSAVFIILTTLAFGTYLVCAILVGPSSGDRAPEDMHFCADECTPGAGV